MKLGEMKSVRDKDQECTWAVDLEARFHPLERHSVVWC